MPNIENAPPGHQWIPGGRPVRKWTRAPKGVQITLIFGDEVLISPRQCLGQMEKSANNEFQSWHLAPKLRSLPLKRQRIPRAWGI